MANERLEKYYSTASSTRHTQTISLWFKQKSDDDFGQFFVSGQEQPNDGIYTKVGINPDGRIEVRWWGAGGSNFASRYSNQLVRDSSNWYHIVYVFDTNNGNSADRIRVYLNGNRVTSWNSASDPVSGQLTWFGDNSKKHRICAYNYASDTEQDHFDGLVSEMYFVDGQALDPSVFAKSTDSNDWQPKHPDGVKAVINSAGGFGTAGFYIPFNTNSIEDVDSTISYDPSTLYANKLDSHIRLDYSVNQNWAEYGSLTTHTTGGPLGQGYVSGWGQPTSSSSTTGADGLQTGYASSVATWGAKTLMAWVKSSETGVRSSQWHVKVPVFGDYRGSVYGAFGIDDGKVAFGNASVYRGTTVIADGNWHHIALTFDGSDTFQMYVDGTADGSTFARSSLTSPNNLLLDCIGFTYAYSGIVNPTALAGVQIIDRQLSQTEIQDTIAGKIFTMGKDQSGKGNHYIFKGVRVIQPSDVPTNNFCILDGHNHKTTGTITRAGTYISTNGNTWSNGIGSFAVTSGKWYFETLPEQSGTNSFRTTGIATADGLASLPNYLGSHSETWGIHVSNLYWNGGGTPHGISTPQGSTIVQVALDADAGKVWFGINGTWYNSGDPVTGANPSYSNIPTNKKIFVGVSMPDTGIEDYHVNFGAGFPATSFSNTTHSDDNGYGSFYYDPPTGFLSLCSKNLTQNVDPSENFTVVKYTGDNSYPRQINTGFETGIVWVKNLGGYHWRVFDYDRGSAPLYINNDSPEDNFNDGPEVSCNSTGFQIIDNPDGTAGTGYGVNVSGQEHLAICFKTGNTPVTNNDGSVQSYVCANPTAGISAIKYTGGQSQGATIGHGLGGKPSVLITKSRNTGSWGFYYDMLNPTDVQENWMKIDSTDANGSGNYVLLRDSTFEIAQTGAFGNGGGNSDPMIAYAFRDIPGFSSFGTYTGNDSSNGPFVYTGFKPALVIVKSYNTTGDWWVVDNTRNYNGDTTNVFVRLNTTGGAIGNEPWDFYSNGFKAKYNGAGSSTNNSGVNYIYMAFAESPFKHATAR